MTKISHLILIQSGKNAAEFVCDVTTGAPILDKVLMKLFHRCCHNNDTTHVGPSMSIKKSEDSKKEHSYATVPAEFVRTTYGSATACKS